MKSPALNSLYVACLLMLLGTPCAGSATARHAAVEQAAKLISTLDREHVPGGVVGILDLRSGEWIHRQAFGLADLHSGARNTPDTLMGVASVSKQFTAAAVAIAAQEGYFSLDDDVRKYIPELREYSRPITLRHLIHHTNGLRDEGWLVKLSGKPGLYTKQSALIQLIARQRAVNFAAGDEFRYGNAAYVLLAEVLERTTRRAFNIYVREKIFTPLGMSRSYFVDDSTGVKDHAIAYQLEAGQWVDTGLFEPARRGTGGLMTTLDDYALWIRNLLSDHSKMVGGTALTKLLQTPGRLRDGNSTDYGFGLEIKEYRGVPCISHDGSGGGYKAEVMVFPQQSFAIFGFWNNGVYPAATVLALADLFLDKAAGSAVDLREPAITLPLSKLASLVGLYREPTLGSAIEVTFDGRGLTIRYKVPSYTIEPLSSVRFRTSANLQMKFDRDADERGLRIRQLPTGDWTIGTGVFERVQPARLTARELQVYAGEYYSEEIDTTYSMTVEHDALVMRIAGSEPGVVGSEALPVVLQPLAADEFISIPHRMVFDFERGSVGVARGLSLNAQHGWITKLRFERRQ